LPNKNQRFLITFVPLNPIGVEMDLIINHRSETIETRQESITVEELLSMKNFSYKMLMVRVNGTNVKREDYPLASVKSGDNVEVIHLISGG
jgi:thiamine biosynthesis protein ThiS